MSVSVSSFFKLLGLGKSGQRRTLPIQIDITNACNLSCTHCYHSHHQNKGVLTLDQWLEVLNECDNLLKKLRLKPRLIICGGEPLLSSSLIPIIEYATQLWGQDVEIAILTNGTFVTNNFLKKIKTLNVMLQISMDGPNSKLHDSKRGKGSFDKTIHGVRRAQSAGVPVILQTVLSKLSSDKIEDFFRLAKSFNIKELHFVRFVAKGQGESLLKSREDEPLKGASLQMAYQKILKYSRTFRVYTNKYSPLWTAVA